MSDTTVDLEKPSQDTDLKIEFQQGLDWLIEEGKENKKPPEDDPKFIHLDSIHTAHSVFQPRQFTEGTKAYSEEHTQSLVEAIFNEPTHQLDPIVVWWSGLNWKVIDGAHRLMAYRRVNKKGKLKNLQIPVVIFKGDLYKAIEESTKLNSKDKLQMSKSDKANVAWKLTALEKHSKKQIHRACKVGTTTVSRMREVLALIKEAHPNDYSRIALDYSWEEAQKFGKEERVRDDSWEEKQALEWSNRLAKAYGIKASNQPAIFARAIELYSQRLPKELLRNWREEIEELLEEDLSSDF